MIGFLEESEGVRSMSRLTVAWMCGLATVLVGTIAWYVVTLKTDAKESVILALGGALVTIVAKGAIAIINRNSPSAS